MNICIISRASVMILCEIEMSTTRQRRSCPRPVESARLKPMPDEQLLTTSTLPPIPANPASLHDDNDVSTSTILRSDELTAWRALAIVG